MPTEFLVHDEDDDDVVEVLSSGKEESKPPATATANVNKPTKTTSVTPKPKSKPKPAAANNKKAASKKRKGPVKGQMTLGAFFTGAPPASKAPQAPVISEDKKAELKLVVLGKPIPPKSPKAMPRFKDNKPRKVSPDEPDRKTASDIDSSPEHEPKLHEKLDQDETTVVDTPLAKETKSRNNESEPREASTLPKREPGTGETSMEADENPSAPDCPTEAEEDTDTVLADVDTVVADSDNLVDTFSSVDSPLRPPNKAPLKASERGKGDVEEDDVDMKDVTAEEKEENDLSNDVEDKMEVEPVVQEEAATKEAPPAKEAESCPKTKTNEPKNDQSKTSASKQSQTNKRLDSMKETDCADSAAQQGSTSNDAMDVVDKTEKYDDKAPSQTDKTTVASQKESIKKTATEAETKQDLQRVKLQGLYDTYFPQAVTLFAACREGLVNSVPALDRTVPEEAPSSAQEAKTLLATLIEGRSESLATLAAEVAPHLQEHFPTVDTVTEEIKLLAKRQPLVKDYVMTVLEETAKPKLSPNLFQDESPDRFWQWQVTVMDLLPNKFVVKQRRAKIRKEVQYLHHLVTVLQTLKQILQSETGDRKSLLAKLSRQEEKVLQYQREQNRLELEQQLKEAQRQEKEKAKAAKKEAEAAKKKEAAAAKAVAKKEAATAKKEAAAAAAAAKKEAQAKEAVEKARIEEEKKQKKKASLNRQQHAMMSFLKKAASTPKKQKEPVAKEPAPELLLVTKKLSSGFDVESFRSQINSAEHDAVVPFGSQSESARRSRRRKYKSVQIRVYVTVVPDNEWGARPYAELQEVSVRNRNKFLSFHEDVRPAYHGTWSKKSYIVNPRNPFKKDREVFDYDYDSEAEWEEGDNEAGEDIENAADDEEEKEEEEDGDEDGWLAADDDLDDDPDEETKLLRQTVVRQDGKEVAILQSYIAPVNGRPMTLSDDTSRYVDGISVDEALQLLSSHTEKASDEIELYLDPFPPTLIEESVAPSSPSDSKDTKIANMQSFLRFVHGNSIGSKEKLVDELRSKLPDVMSSRAQALRTLETVAEKQKHPIKGCVWEVKKEVLEQYDLGDVLEEATNVDPEEAKKQVLRTIASHIHNSTHTSKEKLVDDLQANHSSILVSRAETLRHVESLAEKKKRSGGGVVWEVTPTAQKDLGIELGMASETDDKDETDGTSSDVKEGPSSAKKRKLNDQLDQEE